MEKGEMHKLLFSASPNNALGVLEVHFWQEEHNNSIKLLALYHLSVNSPQAFKAQLAKHLHARGANCPSYC